MLPVLSRPVTLRMALLVCCRHLVVFLSRSYYRNLYMLISPRACSHLVLFVGAMSGEDSQARVPEDSLAVGGGTGRSQLCKVCLKGDRTGHRWRYVKPETALQVHRFALGGTRVEESIPTSRDFSWAPITSYDSLCEQSECL